MWTPKQRWEILRSKADNTSGLLFHLEASERWGLCDCEYLCSVDSRDLSNSILRLVFAFLNFYT